MNVPSITIPNFRPKCSKSIPVFRPKWLKNHTLWGSTYLYTTYRGVPPPRLIISSYSSTRPQIIISPEMIRQWDPAWKPVIPETKPANNPQPQKCRDTWHQICTLLAGKFSNLHFISFTWICIISSLETFFHFNIDYLSRNSYLFLPSDILILELNYRRLYICPITMIPFLRSKTPKYTAFFIQSNLSLWAPLYTGGPGSQCEELLLFF